MPINVADRGIILKKRIIRDNLISLTIFSQLQGKLIMRAWGVKKITSRRLSHLETGNYIKFNYSTRNQYHQLDETELIYAYSKIRSDLDKLRIIYSAIFLLDKILAVNQPEPIIFSHTLDFFKQLNNRDVTGTDVDNFLTRVMIEAGFVDSAHVNSAAFDIESVIEDVIGQRVAKKF